MTLWSIVLGMGVITFVLRLTLIIGANHVRLPAPVEQALRYAPVAVLSAIIFAEIAGSQAEWFFSLENPRLLPGTVAAVVAWRTKNVLLTIAAGMLLFWLL